MPRRRLLAVPLVALVVVACGTQEVELPAADAENTALAQGATLFDERCAACHTLTVAGAHGSAVEANTREYKDGPNFNQRVESYEDVLYAIRNGGFSSGPMPQNLVTGREAELVARFVAKYSGADAERVPVPGTEQPPGTEEPGAAP